MSETINGSQVCTEMVDFFGAPVRTKLRTPMSLRLQVENSVDGQVVIASSGSRSQFPIGNPQRVAGCLVQIVLQGQVRDPFDRRPAEPVAVDAERLAIEALGYVPSEPDLLRRFLDLTDIGADVIR